MRERGAGLKREIKRVLVVDDEQNIGAMLSKYLRSSGYACESFTDPAKALGVLRRNDGRREGEVIKHPAVGGLVLRPVGFDLRPGRLLPLRQALGRLGMEIVAQALELRFRGDTGQAEVFGALAEPVAGRVLAFGVIVADAQMLAEILFGVANTVLRFGRKHDLSVRRQAGRRLAGSGGVGCG